MWDYQTLNIYPTFYYIADMKRSDYIKSKYYHSFELERDYGKVLNILSFWYMKVDGVRGEYWDNWWSKPLYTMLNMVGM